MPNAVSPKTRARKNVAPMTADHGMNPGWGVYEERPVIPEFNGVAEISRLAMMFTLWGRVESYLYEDIGIDPLAEAKEEKKHRAVLLESETFLVALLCLLNNEHYSAGGLVDAMVGVNATADQRGNARKRILNRTLPIVGDRYGLIDFSERHMGNSMEYSICRSQRLVDFAETQLVSGFNAVLEIPLVREHSDHSQGDCDQRDCDQRDCDQGDSGPKAAARSATKTQSAARPDSKTAKESRTTKKKVKKNATAKTGEAL